MTRNWYIQKIKKIDNMIIALNQQKKIVIKQFNQSKIKKNKYQKKYIQSPKGKEKIKGYNKKYYQKKKGGEK